MQTHVYSGASYLLCPFEVSGVCRSPEVSRGSQCHQVTLDAFALSMTQAFPRFPGAFASIARSLGTSTHDLALCRVAAIRMPSPRRIARTPACGTMRGIVGTIAARRRVSVSSGALGLERSASGSMCPPNEALQMGVPVCARIQDVSGHASFQNDAHEESNDADVDALEQRAPKSAEPVGGWSHPGLTVSRNGADSGRDPSKFARVGLNLLRALPKSDQVRSKSRPALAFATGRVWAILYDLARTSPDLDRSRPM